MNFSDLVLPSNRKFGSFFTLVFLVAASYFFLNKFVIGAYISITLAVIFFIVTLVKADVLLSFNKLWMRFGLLLGTIVTPIILGLIFFVLFTPIAFIMRLCGRDELRLKFKKKSSHWIKREVSGQTESFKNQF
jgi:hypothetical protein